MSPQYKVGIYDIYKFSFGMSEETLVCLRKLDTTMGNFGNLKIMSENLYRKFLGIKKETEKCSFCWAFREGLVGGEVL